MEHQREHGGQLGQVLVEYGYITTDTLDLILQLQSKGRLLIQKQRARAEAGTPGGDGQ